MWQPRWAQRLDDGADAWLRRRLGIGLTAGATPTKRQKMQIVLMATGVALLILLVAFLTTEPRERAALIPPLVGALLGSLLAPALLRLRRRR